MSFQWFSEKYLLADFISRAMKKFWNLAASSRYIKWFYLLILSRVHASQWPKKSLIEFYWKFQRQIIIIYLVCTDWSDFSLCDSKIILEVYMTGILRRKAQLKTPSTIHNGQLYCQNMNDIKQLAKRYSLQYTGKTIEENLKQAYERVLEDWNPLTETFEVQSLNWKIVH